MKAVVIFFSFVLFVSQGLAKDYILKSTQVLTQESLKPYGLQILRFNPAAQLYQIRSSNSEKIKSFLTAENKSFFGVQFLVPDQTIQIRLIQGAESTKTTQSQWGLEKIHVSEAWKLAGNQGSKKIVVALIDTGVDSNHPDLKGNIVEGYDFTTNTTNSMDKNGHGTHCAGVIGATGNSANGVFGVSPNVSIMPLKFLSPTGAGSLYIGIQAIDYAIQKKVDIISASWGAQIGDPVLAQELKNAGERADKAGVILVAAAGNLNRDNDQVDYLPGNANTASTVSVAATDPMDRKIKISNYGSQFVHLAAPGESILSTFLKNKYKPLTGTSMATPMVAGLLALLKAQNPELSGAELRNILQKTGDSIDMQNACKCRINAEAAMKMVLSEIKK